DVPYAGRLFCRELARRVLAAHGIPMPLVDRPEAATDWQRVPAPRALDVVVFTTAGQPRHVGVCVDRSRFLHVEEGERSRIDRLGSIAWASRIDGFYRYTGAACPQNC